MSAPRFSRLSKQSNESPVSQLQQAPTSTRTDSSLPSRFGTMSDSEVNEELPIIPSICAPKAKEWSLDGLKKGLLYEVVSVSLSNDEKLIVEKPDFWECARSRVNVLAEKATLGQHVGRMDFQIGLDDAADQIGIEEDEAPIHFSGDEDDDEEEEEGQEEDNVHGDNANEGKKEYSPPTDAASLGESPAASNPEASGQRGRETLDAAESLLIIVGKTPNKFEFEDSSEEGKRSAAEGAPRGNMDSKRGAPVEESGRVPTDVLPETNAGDGRVASVTEKSADGATNDRVSKESEAKESTGVDEGPAPSIDDSQASSKEAARGDGATNNRVSEEGEEKESTEVDEEPATSIDDTARGDGAKNNRVSEEREAKDSMDVDEVPDTSIVDKAQTLEGPASEEKAAGTATKDDRKAASTVETSVTAAQKDSIIDDGATKEGMESEKSAVTEKTSQGQSGAAGDEAKAVTEENREEEERAKDDGSPPISLQSSTEEKNHPNDATRNGLFVVVSPQASSIQPPPHETDHPNAQRSLSFLAPAGDGGAASHKSTAVSFDGLNVHTVDSPSESQPKPPLPKVPPPAEKSTAGTTGHGPNKTTSSADDDHNQSPVVDDQTAKPKTQKAANASTTAGDVATQKSARTSKRSARPAVANDIRRNKKQKTTKKVSTPCGLYVDIEEYRFSTTMTVKGSKDIGMVLKPADTIKLGKKGPAKRKTYRLVDFTTGHFVTEHGIFPLEEFRGQQLQVRKHGQNKKWEVWSADDFWVQRDPSTSRRIINGFRSTIKEEIRKFKPLGTSRAGKDYPVVRLSDLPPARDQEFSFKMLPPFVDSKLPTIKSEYMMVKFFLRKAYEVHPLTDDMADAAVKDNSVLMDYFVQTTGIAMGLVPAHAKKLRTNFPLEHVSSELDKTNLRRDAKVYAMSVLNSLLPLLKGFKHYNCLSQGDSDVSKALALQHHIENLFLGNWWEFPPLSGVQLERCPLVAENSSNVI